MILTRYLHSQKLVRCGKETVYVMASLIQVEQQPTPEAKEDWNGNVEDSGGSHGVASSEACFWVQDPATGARYSVEPIFRPEAQSRSSVQDMQTRLADDEVVQYIGGYMISFRPRFYYWMGYEMLVRLLQTSAVIIVRILDTRYDLYYMLLVTMCAIVVHTYVQPYVSHNVNILQALTLLSQGICCLGYVATREIPEVSNNFVGIILILMQVALTMLVALYIVRELRVHLNDEESLLYGLDKKAVGTAQAFLNRYSLAIQTRGARKNVIFSPQTPNPMLEYLEEEDEEASEQSADNDLEDPSASLHPSLEIELDTEIAFESLTWKEGASIAMD